MKDRFLILIFMIAASTTILLPGCAATHNMVGHAYTTETVPDPQTYFSQIWAAESSGGLKISGKLRLKTRLGVNVPEYVEVALIDQEGAVLDQQKVPYFPRALTGSSNHRDARFVAYFANTPPPGSIIRLRNVD